MLILILGLSAATIAFSLTGAYIARHRRMTIERIIRAWERGDFDKKDKREGV